MGEGRPPERADQDPRDASRASRRSPSRIGRGHQRQRHADLQPRALPRGHPRVPGRTRAGARPPASTCRRSTRSRRSSSRASTPRSTSASTAIGTPEALALRARPASPTPGSPTSSSRRSSPPSARRRCSAAGANRAAAAVGLDRRQGPGAARHALRDRARRAPASSTRCPRRRSRRRSTTASSTGDTVTGAYADAGEVLDALAARRRRLRRRHRAARERGRREVHRLVERAARHRHALRLGGRRR